jgi:ankyrin repeat protein
MNSEKDDELTDVIKSLFPDSLPNIFVNTYDPNRSKLSDEKKAEIKRLVDAGASLSNIDALHLAASHYKEPDLFDLLIDEYGLGIEDSDHDSLLSKPLHVAACMGNCEAIVILLAKGADKKSRNSKGRTPLQEVKHEDRQMQRGGMPDFMYEKLRREFKVDIVISMLSR